MSYLAKRCALVLLLSLGTVACGEGFDPVSDLRTLRAIGVAKNKSYANPGDEITMDLVWQDASKDAPRDVTIAWMPACFNPPGDLFYGCFAQFGSTDPDNMGSLSEKLTFTIPEDILSSRPPPDPDNPAFGTAFGFFALCAGDLVPLDPPPSKNALPLGCRDRTSGDLLGPDEFVAGYAQVMVFADGFANANPNITGFTVEGNEVETDCIGVLCAKPGTPSEPEPEPIDCTDEANAARCIATCEDDGEDTCPDIDIAPIVTRDSAEPDEVAARYYGRADSEQLWIDYYSDRGTVRSPARLLNDATQGWNDDYGVEFWAPKEPGPLSVWAAVHDNRGGANFVRVRLQAEQR
jgi:hypothetical protein